MRFVGHRWTCPSLGETFWGGLEAVRCCLHRLRDAVTYRCCQMLAYAPPGSNVARPHSFVSPTIHRRGSLTMSFAVNRSSTERTSEQPEHDRAKLRLTAFARQHCNMRWATQRSPIASRWTARSCWGVMATRRTLVSRASYDRSLHVCAAGPARIVGGAGAAGKALRLGVRDLRRCWACATSPSRRPVFQEPRIVSARHDASLRAPWALD